MKEKESAPCCAYNPKSKTTPTSSTCPDRNHEPPRMAKLKRAAQFAPFAALNGYAEMIEQANRKQAESITY